MRELQIQKIVSPDTIHYLFGNLNALVDFQRRFLIQLEEIAEKSPLEQRIGHLFIQMEESFSVYEPYCSNYYSAQDLVVQETPRLQKLADILNPIYELPSMLIKPVQRICKYPLLLQELLKSTDKEWPYYHETQTSVEAIKRVTEKVNETQRQHENIQAVQELKKRLDDWKQLTIDGYGNLLLQDKLSITTTDNNERDLHVFCFEQVLLFCKESKGNNLLPKGNTLSINKRKTRRGSLVPKFIIQTSSMTDLSSRCNKNGIWCLNIDLNQDDVESLSIKFRNEEQLKLWTTTLTKAIQKAAAIAAIAAIAAFENETKSKSMQHISIEEEDEDDLEEDEEDIEDDSEVEFYDDEGDDDLTRVATTISNSTKMNRSRSTSFNTAAANQSTTTMTSTKSMKQLKDGRPYHNVPGMNLSPLPRSFSSSTTSSTAASPPLPPINSSHYHSNYYPASPPPSHPSSPTSSARITTGGGPNRQLGDIASNFLNNEYSSQDYHQHFIQASNNYPPHSLLSTGRSQSQSGAMERVNNQQQQRPSLPIHQNRLRSQSSPNIMKNNVAKEQQQILMTPSESLPVAAAQPPKSKKPAPLDLSKEKQPQLIRNVASTPRLTDMIPLSPGAIKIKLNFNDGIYVIVTNHEVTFFELMEKVDKKIRLVANLKGTDLLRLKYQDEDGDFITINSDDDVQMAFETRFGTVNLFVSL
jgi:hypothetical protein